MNKTAFLIFDSRGAEIRHRCGLTAPDPFIYLQPEGEKSVVYFNALEYGAQKEILVQLKNGVKIERIDTPPLVALTEILKNKKITAVKVPPSFPFQVANQTPRGKPRGMQKFLWLIISQERMFPTPSLQGPRGKPRGKDKI